MGGKRSKSAGTSYEYRVANWFADKEGWNGLRNPLSGASGQIEEAVGKHDVRAWHDSLPIFLQLECKKKTGKGSKPNEIIILREWTDKVDFFKDELLVFATNRSPHYAFLPLKRYFELLGRSYEIEYDEKTQHFRGEKQFVFKRGNIDDAEDKRFHLTWGADREEWVAILLEDFVMLRETADIQDELTLEEKIKRLTTLKDCQEFEKLYLPEMNYKQKRMLYGKFEQVESGTIVDPMAHAESQFWLDDSFIIACPHCKEKITKKDLNEDS